jgi:hypothetical protein
VDGYIADLHAATQMDTELKIFRMHLRCWAFDMEDRPDTRPEIEPFTWEISSDQGQSWPVSAKEKPDLILFDPPSFDKKAADYDEKHFRAV